MIGLTTFGIVATLLILGLSWIYRQLDDKDCFDKFIFMVLIFAIVMCCIDFGKDVGLMEHSLEVAQDTYPRYVSQLEIQKDGSSVWVTKLVTRSPKETP